MSDYLSVIRLGQGAGQPGKQACWMTALQSHIGGEWTDNCECVDPTINRLCIWVNDSYGSGKDADTERTRDIMEFGLFEPLGTLGNKEETERRMYRLLDVALRTWIPIWLRLEKKEKEAATMEACDPIVDHESFMAAHAIAIANAYAIAIANAYANAIANAYAYANAYANAIANAYAYANAYANAYAIANAYAYAYANANANANAKKDFAKKHVLPLLRELIDMGPCAPKEVVPEPVCGVSKFLELCGAR